MGHHVSTEQVTNKIDIFIEQTNEQYSKIVKSAMTDVVNKASNTQIAKVQNDAGAFNDIEITNVHLSNGAHLNNVLTSKVKLAAKALLSITQDQKIMEQIANQAQDNIKQSIDAKQDLKSDIQLTADLEKKKENSGELNSFINGVTDTINKLVDNGKDEKTITNEVKQSLIIKDKTDSDIENYIKNSFNTQINMSSINDCLSTSTSSNHLSLDGIWMDGKDTSFDNIVDAYTEQIQDCIISTLLSTEMTTALQNLDSTTSDQGVTAGQSSDVKAKTDTKMIDSQKSTSFLDIIMQNLTIIIAIIGVVIVLAIIFLGGPTISKIFSSMKNKRFRGSKGINIGKMAASVVAPIVEPIAAPIAAPVAAPVAAPFVAPKLNAFRK